MNRPSIGTLALLALLAAGVGPTPAARADELRVGGLAWADHATILADENGALEGLNGFQIRRINLNFNRRLDEAFDAHVRLETTQRSLQAAAAGGGSSMEPFVKDAWLRWRYREGHAAIAGLSATPFLALSQKFWGLRRIEKVVADLEKMGSTRDIGLALEGELGGEGWGYHFMVGNGNGTSEDADDGKTVQLALRSDTPDRALVAEIVGKIDFGNDPAPGDRLTVKGLLGLRGDRGRAGVEVAHQTRQDAAVGGGDETLLAGSIFGVLALSGRVDAFARVDHAFDATAAGDTNYHLPIRPGFEHTVVIGGVDIALSEVVVLTPNLQAVVYGEDAGGGGGPDVTAIGRLSLAVKF